MSGQTAQLALPIAGTILGGTVGSIFPVVGTAAGAAIGGSLGAAASGGIAATQGVPKMKTPSVPQAPTPTTTPELAMPDPGDILQKKKKQAMTLKGLQGGRASTILSDSDKLGG